MGEWGRKKKSLIALTLTPASQRGKRRASIATTGKKEVACVRRWDREEGKKKENRPRIGKKKRRRDPRPIYIRNGRVRRGGRRITQPIFSATRKKMGRGEINLPVLSQKKRGKERYPFLVMRSCRRRVRGKKEGERRGLLSLRPFRVCPRIMGGGRGKFCEFSVGIIRGGGGPIA